LGQEQDALDVSAPLTDVLPTGLCALAWSGQVHDADGLVDDTLGAEELEPEAADGEGLSLLGD